ncbi:uncharacterized protein LOC110858749 isoform X2 [Folsomia candida]|uniref:uncharacterized protein LOC110858749 isoform X2 n=1 Tax=Folsomia candida TaxID=158441 RepID=UPI000B909DE7|nr:uncharacterized protein LOC110858749 isoform X2 [Folsomia candida]
MQQVKTLPIQMKDLCVLVTLATTLSSCLVTYIFGWDVLMERCISLDLTSVLVTLVVCVLIISALTYVLLRVAAQYLVYVGLGVLLAIVYSCHPSRVLPFINKLFTKAKEKQQGQKQL